MTGSRREDRPVAARPTRATRASGTLVAGARRIAVLRGSALGDLVVALPALEALRAAYPAAHIALLGREHHQALLCSRPSPVDEVIVLPEGAVGDEARTMDPGVRDALLESLAARGWDLAIQLHGGGRNSNRFLHRLGARVTAGSRTPDAPALDRWVPYEHYQWEVGRGLEIVGLVGARPAALEPRLDVVDGDRVALGQQLPELHRGPWVVLHPGATDPRRRWPVDRFARVGRDLLDGGRRVVVTGVGGEAVLLRELAARLGFGDGVVVADHLSLPALVALLGGADVLVGNDSGPLHLAAAAGAPTVGIFWVGNLINAGPLTRRRHRPLIAWRTQCPSCGRDATAPRCSHDDSWVDEVPASAAIEAARRVIDDGG